MKRPFSIYLDLVRFAAAVLVFIHHLNIRWISEARLPFGNSAQLGVICFFIMSGCVVAYVTEKKEKSLLVYADSRCARIYSVALPAIVIVPLLDMGGRYFGGHIYASVPNDLHIVRMIAAFLFMNEFWTQSILLFSDGPYWSLCYEVWYYTVFGVLLFMRRRLKWLVVLAIALAVGPKIILLAPIWFAGVKLYHADSRLLVSSAVYFSAAFGGALGVIAFAAMDTRVYLIELTQAVLPPAFFSNLLHARGFLADWLLAAAIFAHLFGMKLISDYVAAPLLRWETQIRFLAKSTFALYLFHQPLMYFWASLLKPDNHSGIDLFLLVSAILVSVFILTECTDHLHSSLKGSLAKLLRRARCDARLRKQEQ